MITQKITGVVVIGCVAFTAWMAGCAPLVQEQPVAPPPAGKTVPPSGAATPRATPNVNLSGYPPAFKDGFSDGCDSLRGNYRRDASRFGKDNDYTLGWQDGYSICGRQKR
jgi:hypothetical protein